MDICTPAIYALVLPPLVTTTTYMYNELRRSNIIMEHMREHRVVQDYADFAKVRIILTK